MHRFATWSAVVLLGLSIVVSGMLVSLTTPILLKILLPQAPEISTVQRVSLTLDLAIVVGWLVGLMVAFVPWWRCVAPVVVLAKFVLSLQLLVGFDTQPIENGWRLATIHGFSVFSLAVSHTALPIWFFRLSRTNGVWLPVLVGLGFVGYAVGLGSYQFAIEPFMEVHLQMTCFAGGLTVVGSLEMVVACLFVAIVRKKCGPTDDRGTEA